MFVFIQDNSEGGLIMSLGPEQPYVHPVFDSAQPVKDGCPLCWGNSLLRGGKVLTEGEVFYVYVFETDDGRLYDCFIAPKEHHPDMTTLPPNWGEEFSKCYALLINTYGITQHNGYWSEGFGAGQRVLGHWHVRVDEAPEEGSPAYGKGLALLRREFNKCSAE